MDVRISQGSGLCRMTAERVLSGEEFWEDMS